MAVGLLVIEMTALNEGIGTGVDVRGLGNDLGKDGEREGRDASCPMLTGQSPSMSMS